MTHAKEGREGGVCDPRVFCASKKPSFLARWRVRERPAVRGPAGTGSVGDGVGEGECAACGDEFECPKSFRGKGAMCSVSREEVKDAKIASGRMPPPPLPNPPGSADPWAMVPRALGPSTPSVSTGFTAAAAPNTKALAEYAKMKAKLTALGCWKGNGRASIEFAAKEGKITPPQYERYLMINKASNGARHDA